MDRSTINQKILESTRILKRNISEKLPSKTDKTEFTNRKIREVYYFGQYIEIEISGIIIT
jgi:hypothetical protein